MKVSELYKELSNVCYARAIGFHGKTEYVCNICSETHPTFDECLEHIFLNHKDETIPDVDPVETI